MRRRSLGTIALTLVSVLVGLYSQFAAMTLVIAGSVFVPSGSAVAQAALLMGLLFLGVMVIAYTTALGFWAGRSWAWASGLTVFGTLIVASVLLALISTNALSAVAPTVGAVIGIWYLLRPATKAELSRSGAPAGAVEAATTGSLEAPQVAH